MVSEFGDRVIYIGVCEGCPANTVTINLMIKNLIMGNSYIVQDIRKFFEFLAQPFKSTVYYKLREFNFWAPYYAFRLDTNFSKEKMKYKYNLK